ncbi:histone-lysine N-methyltransferase SETMAR [Elysia marginata]|uniref:Histone-lysine N-methyltransferase SETMAR n=1 Tax=Elysia marginata TaxID=1093978 RepID=A0AAV4H4I1_9GAST|nr:histone-lysine N-methyltransferase SETMAR [Elysia marginata]
MPRPRVYQWCIWFGEGRTSLDDEPKSGRTKTSTNEENTTCVDELIKCDRRIKMGEIALKLEIPSNKARLNDLETSILSRDPKVQSAEVRSQIDGFRVLGCRRCDPLDILQQHQCINAAQYCSTLDHLRDAIRRKRPGLLRRGVLLLAQLWDPSFQQTLQLHSNGCSATLGNSPSFCP